jgi:hypothetical protein
MAVEETSAADDLALLRRFEPVLRLTAGEMFRPVSVEAYLADATLLLDGRSGTTLLVGPGGLTPEVLAATARQHAGEPLALQYVARPLSRSEYQDWRRRGGRPPFRASSAAVAVGLVGRLLAALTRISLIVRGRVPGGWAAAASQQASRATDTTCHYYGRVTRDAGYVALQYWFLYPMNDWRSSFGGVNDHEADWEQITVFAVEGADGHVQPRWVAFSSHDETGADLRRRVDDPDLEWVGDHPVVYVGAGSHSGAYLPGEYLVSVPLALPGWLESARRAVLRVLPWGDPTDAGIGVPYLDYRRGDGPTIGPGQQDEWAASLVDDDIPWVRDYRGLWGLDTRDPLGGERAPAGPRYERDGTVRPSWAQPVAWAALDGEPAGVGVDDPTDLLVDLRARMEALNAQLSAERQTLRARVAADRARRLSPLDPSALVADQQRVVSGLRHQAVDLRAEYDALADVGPGLPVPGVHDHLRRRILPLALAPATAPLRVWAAVSATVVLGSLGLVLLLGQGPVIAPLLAVAVAAILVEAVLRRQLVRLLLSVAITVVVLGIGYLMVGAVLGNLRDTAGLLLLAFAAYLAVRAVLDASATWDRR